MTNERSPARRSLREAQKQLTRDRLLRAGAVVFARDGYGSATIDQLAAEAGASRATFYLHFSSKLQLMRALLETLQPGVAALYDPLLASPPTREAVEAFLTRVFDFYAENREIISASTQAEAIDAAYTREIEALTWRLARRIVGPDEPERLLQAAFAVQELDRMAYFHSARGWGFERAAAIALLVPRWLALLQP